MGNNAETVPCGRKRKKPCTINYMRLREVKECVKKRERGKARQKEKKWKQTGRLMERQRDKEKDVQR